MLDKNNIRQLVYVVIIDNILPIEGADRVEQAVVGGWRIMTRKGQFKPGDPAIYFEIDSKVPEAEPFKFLESKHYKVKTQKYFKGTVISQGLLMSAEDFGWKINYGRVDLDKVIPYIIDDENNNHFPDDETRFLTEKLGVKYAVDEDNVRKAASKNPNEKYKYMVIRHSKLFKKPIFRWLMQHRIGRQILFIFFGKKKDSKTSFPTHFPYIKKTDQERCENMTWVLNDKTPFIVTQKCDGSSGTYILERKKFNKFEFYVCSRNVRQLTPEQKSFYDDNYYWECAIKYDIENKLKDYLKKHPELNYVCWQGEVCSPKIQGNPHGLTETHLFCFHMIDSEKGKYDIRDAIKIWKEYNMETVPLVCENYILPDDFEEFKLEADGKYDPSCCEGKIGQSREGFVYYKTTDPNFSFKNVSRTYLLKHGS